MTTWDIDIANSEHFQTEQAAMAKADKGDADALGWAWSRAKLAEAEGLVPCPECGCGFYGGCETCWDEGVLNPDGTPLHDHASWDDYYQWLEKQQEGS